MHRKYVQGKRNNRTKRVAVGNMVQQKEQVPDQHVEFFMKVANIPVVHSAIEVASDVYTKAKVSAICKAFFFLPRVIDV